MQCPVPRSPLSGLIWLLCSAPPTFTCMLFSKVMSVIHQAPSTSSIRTPSRSEHYCGCHGTNSNTHELPVAGGVAVMEAGTPSGLKAARCAVF